MSGGQYDHATEFLTTYEGCNMTASSPRPLGQFCWSDLMTPDVAAAQRFYAAVLGWEAREGDPQFGGYFMFFHKDLPVAGGMPDMSEGQMPSSWTSYIAVSDAAASMAAVESNGGTVISGAMEVGTLGVMGVFLDPSGVHAGVWEPRDFMGFGAVDQVGTPRWFQLNTEKFDDVKGFYEQTFGWTTSMMSDTADFRYATANEGETQYAGLFDITSDPSSSPRWLVYFGVENADTAVAAALANGGSVVRDVEDTPYGRLAVVADPAGAIFALMQ